MTQIRITKEFTFEAAHMLNGYDGLCKDIHGHSYRLVVTILGETITDINSPKLGMVMDFGDLKRIIYENIVHVFDHALVANESESEEKKLHLMGSTGKVIFTPFQPTSENMVTEFARIINKKLPAHLNLISVKLYETANSYAEWCATDNQN
jgi:6-pyruvoyltetrahydropterin/6-carboxytetrahydropterin synthase